MLMKKEYDIGLDWGAIVCVYHVEIHWSGSFTPHSMIRSCINKQLLSRYIIARPDIRASECMRQKGTYNQEAIYLRESSEGLTIDSIIDCV